MCKTNSWIFARISFCRRVHGQEHHTTTCNKAHCISKQIIFMVITLTRPIYKIYNFERYFCIAERLRWDREAAASNGTTWWISHFMCFRWNWNMQWTRVPYHSTKQQISTINIIRFGVSTDDGNICSVFAMVEIVFRKKSFIVWNLAIYFRPYTQHTHKTAHIFLLLSLLPFGYTLENACTPIHSIT